ncbi:DUF294 nucleotidyltransferase-like domain-containing protein [Botryobacter ruber]|uniref:DUF294 nucleotidyltransferase-like domain-containing protein n=1 Tax=Botryobacter ruber TaxID=2171629 RepID=UPI000E0AC857|nr:DUF294 nucleotidyltransferase-like domain-containing protein [Botryobacter ruber]
MQASNTIQERVHEFLQQYPPFNLVKEDELRTIARQVRVMYLEPEQVLFKQDEAAHDYFYVVRQGSVRMEIVDEKGMQLLDVCDEGDVFGVRALITRKNYSSTAIASEETLLYAIPSSSFAPVLQDNQEVSLYFAAGFAAGASALRRTMSHTHKARVWLRRERNKAPLRLEELVKIAAGNNLLACQPDTPIRLAAKLMTEHDSSFILVWDGQERPVGIVTDTDMRKKVVAGTVTPQDVVSEIMSAPVITIAPEPAMADTLIKMIRNRVKHICVTDDGSLHSKALAVLTEHDLLLAQGNSPAIMVSEIRQTKHIGILPQIRQRAEELLLKYLEQEVKISFIAGVITEINDAIIVRAIQHAEEQLGKPPLRYCWLSMGSEGREEQLLRTDQDSMLVFEDAAAGVVTAAKNYFLQLAALVHEVLESCGFSKCPANMMAGNPEWCQPLSVWKQYYHSWIYAPTDQSLLNASIFFDYRPVYGDFGLSSQLTDNIYESISKERIFLPFLAKNALRNPTPLSFFRNFILERGGEHKDQFDIKLRAMTPLVDAARVLTLQNKVVGENNTIKRFLKLAELEPQNESIYKEAAVAYEIMMRIRALNGLRNHDSGRYIKPEQLSKLERQTLRNTFVTITDIQELLEVRFQLSYIR